MTESTRKEKLNARGEFTPFYGFSLLFDNPGENNLASREDLPGLEIDCNMRDPALKLYAGLHSCLGAIGLQALNDGHSFTALNPASYHVTVWDGLNDGNRTKIDEARRAELGEWLDGFPEGLTGSSFTDLARSSSLTGAGM